MVGVLVETKKNKSDLKDEIMHIDNEINDAKTILKQLEKMEEDFILLDESFGKCLNLLNASVKSQKVNMMLNESYEIKNKNIVDSLSQLGKSREAFTTIMNEYIKNKEKLEAEYKEQLNKD